MWLPFRHGDNGAFRGCAVRVLEAGESERRRSAPLGGATCGFAVPERTTMTTHGGASEDDQDLDDPQPGSRVSLIPTTQPGPALGARLESWFASPGGLAVTAEVRVDPAAVDLLA